MIKPVFIHLAAATFVFSASTRVVWAQAINVNCSTPPAIFNTGYNPVNQGALTLNPQQQDNRWQVLDPAFGSLPALSYPAANSVWTHPYTYRLNGGGFQWAPSPYSNAEWLTPKSDGSSLGAGYTYFKFDFNMDPVVDPSSFALKLTYYADDGIAEIYVNGHPQSGYSGAITPNSWAGSWPNYITAPGALTLNHDWQTGHNEVVYVLVDAGGGGAEGVLIQADRQSVTCRATPATAVPTLNHWGFAMMCAVLAAAGYGFGIRRASKAAR